MEIYESKEGGVLWQEEGAENYLSGFDPQASRQHIFSPVLVWLAPTAHSKRGAAHQRQRQAKPRGSGHEITAAR